MCNELYSFHPKTFNQVNSLCKKTQILHPSHNRIPCFFFFLLLTTSEGRLLLGNLYILDKIDSFFLLLYFFSGDCVGNEAGVRWVTEGVPRRCLTRPMVTKSSLFHQCSFKFVAAIIFDSI
ncbi:unnamed protein product [Coffea canephora]|uniref:Uncharacterized protein n=1 Tax=Coffea canephora TaxID=49390 RepID=A0A068UWF2_COFCA|nr:unnamed protein product [Coffea canephora]